MLMLKKVGGETAVAGDYRKFGAALIVAGPLLGLLYAIFLPFIGLGMLLAVAVRKFFGGLLQSVHRCATFSWKPSEAYLAGKRGRSRRTISRKSEEKKE